MIEHLGQLATNNFFVLIILYLLALFQPRKTLLYIALVLACICITSFIGYPKFYLDYLYDFLTWGNFMPDIELFNIPDDYLPDIHQAFARGAYFSLAVVASFYMVLHPLFKLKEAYKLARV